MIWSSWLKDQRIDHVRGAPLRPQTQGKFERWHQTLKNRILLEICYLPSDLETRIGDFVAHYNHLRYHESIANLTPADVYFGRGQTILLEEIASLRQFRYGTIPAASQRAPSPIAECLIMDSAFKPRMQGVPANDTCMPWACYSFAAK